MNIANEVAEGVRLADQRKNANATAQQVLKDYEASCVGREDGRINFSVLETQLRPDVAFDKIFHAFGGGIAPQPGEPTGDHSPSWAANSEARSRAKAFIKGSVLERHMLAFATGGSKHQTAEERKASDLAQRQNPIFSPLG